MSTSRSSRVGRHVGVRAVPTLVTLALAALLTGCGDAGPVLEEAFLVAEGASNPTAAAGQGGTYVAWVAAGGHESDVWLSRVEPDGSPSPPVRVNDVPGDAAPHLQAPAQVAVGPEGNVYVAWTNNTVVESRRFPTSGLRFARSTDGGRTFEPAVTVNDDRDGPPTSHTFHNLLTAPDGSVIASWLDNRRGEQAALAGDEAGAPEGPDVRVAVSGDGGRSFGPLVVVDEVTCPCCRTSMAMGPDGAPVPRLAQDPRR